MYTFKLINIPLRRIIYIPHALLECIYNMIQVQNIFSPPFLFILWSICYLGMCYSQAFGIFFFLLLFPSASLPNSFLLLLLLCFIDLYLNSTLHWDNTIDIFEGFIFFENYFTSQNKSNLKNSYPFFKKKIHILLLNSANNLNEQILP